MKKISPAFIIPVFALWLTGCAQQEIVPDFPEKATGKIITATAGFEEAQTRVLLTDNYDTNTMEVRWREGDVVYLYYENAEGVVEPLSIAAVKNIRNDGRLADFDIDLSALPSGLSSVTLYGCMRQLTTDFFFIYRNDFVPLDRKATDDQSNPYSPLPRYFKTTIGLPASTVSVTFQDPGTTFLLTVTNNSNLLIRSDLSPSIKVENKREIMLFLFDPKTGSSVGWEGEDLQPISLPYEVEDDNNFLPGAIRRYACWFVPNENEAESNRNFTIRLNDDHAVRIERTTPFRKGVTYRIHLEYTAKADGTGYEVKKTSRSVYPDQLQYTQSFHSQRNKDSWEDFYGTLTWKNLSAGTTSIPHLVDTDTGEYGKIFSLAQHNFLHEFILFRITNNGNRPMELSGTIEADPDGHPNFRFHTQAFVEKDSEYVPILIDPFGTPLLPKETRVFAIVAHRNAWENEEGVGVDDMGTTQTGRAKIKAGDQEYIIELSAQMSNEES